MKTRMNLFRQLESAPKKTISLKPRAEFKLGFHGTTALIITGLSLIAISITYFKQRATLNEVHRKQEEVQAQLAAISAETERLSGEIAAKKREQIEKNAKREVAASGGPVITDRLEPTWSALLWKVSAFTGTKITVQQMDLAYNVGSSPDGMRGRTVVLSGGAVSLSAVREWLDILIRAVPGYDFSIDSNAVSGDVDFPVSFRISAKVL